MTRPAEPRKRRASRRPTASALTQPVVDVMLRHGLGHQIGPMFRQEQEGGFGLYVMDLGSRAYLRTGTFASEPEAERALLLIINGADIIEASCLMN